MMREQRGSASAFLLISWAVILLTLAFAADFGRVFIIREQLRTAEDAAALAGALQMEYRVRFQWQRYRVWSETVCWTVEATDPDADPDEICIEVEHAAVIAPAVITGTEGQVWPKLNDLVISPCTDMTNSIRCAELLEAKCWLAPRNDSFAQVTGAVDSIFRRNQWWGNQATLTGPVRVSLPNQHQVEPAQFPVQVRVGLEMKTYLLAALGIKSIPIERQGGWTTASPTRRGSFSHPGSPGPGAGGIEMPADSPCGLLAP